MSLHGSPVEGGRLPRSFAHHDFNAHATEAGLVLRPGDAEFLTHLGDLMEGGRYPLPLRPGGTPQAWQFTVPHDVERVWALVERLESVLRDNCSQTLPPADLRVRHRPVGYGVAEQGSTLK